MRHGPENNTFHRQAAINLKTNSPDLSSNPSMILESEKNMEKISLPRFSSFNRHFKGHQWDWAYLVILVVALIAHGLLLFNDWEYWDGPAVHVLLRSINLMTELKHYGQNGLPIFGIYLWLMGFFPDSYFSFKLVGFLCFLLSAFFTYRIGKLSGMVSKVESLIVAVIAMIYPVFQASVVNDITGYMVGYLCFISGVMFAIQAERKDGSAHWFFRILALLLLFLGFNFVTSLYVYYFGFLLFWLSDVMRLRAFTIRTFISNFSWRRIDFAILPFLAWGIRTVFYPVSGPYVGYNAFNFNIASIWFWIKKFLYLGILEPYFTLLVRHPWFTISVVFILLTLTIEHRALMKRLEIWFGCDPQTWKLMGFGLILLVMAIFPYVVVAKGPTASVFSAIPFDTNTRQTILLALPMAILTMGIVRSLVMSNIRTLSALGVALLVVVTIESCIVHIEDYVDWQIRSVKDHSLIAQLKKNADIDHYSIIWVDDRFPAGGYRFYADKAFYVYSEWHFIGDFIWPEHGHTLIDASYRGQDPGPLYWNLDTDRSGCQATMVLKRNPDAGSDWNILAHYYYYKFFQPQMMESYLSTKSIRVTSIQLSPLAVPEATHCTFSVNNK